NLETAAAIGKFSAFNVVGRIAAEESLDDADHARMNGEDKTSTSRLERLGNEPGETFVVADSGDQRRFSAQIDGNHTPPPARRIRFSACVNVVRSSKRGGFGQDESV